FFSDCAGDLRSLHSFPTRRSSDLWWVSQRPMFLLRAVRVESMYGLDLEHVNELTVRNSVVGKIKGNFFTTDLEQVRATFEAVPRSEEHTSELQSQSNLVCRLLLEK